MSETSISIEGVSKCFHLYDRPVDRLKQLVLPGRKSYYRENWAVQDITFDLKKGESIGIIGRNGSGKSTLLQMIAGVLEPTHGRITSTGNVAALLELGAGFNPDFSGRENVEMNAALLGLTPSQTAERFDDIVGFSELGEFIDQPVKTYSSGMFMRLAFSVAAHVDADILIIDEALAVGDAFFVQKCMRYLREFQERGSLLFVSHDTGSVTNLCDRAVWLNQGRIEEIGNAKSVCESYFAARYSAEMGISPRVEKNRSAPAQNAAETEDAPQQTGAQVLQSFSFNAESADFGTGQATIVNVELLDNQGEQLRVINGGESVLIRVHAHCDANIDAPIIGFSVKDRLGQHLFGDNSYQRYEGKEVHIPSGQTVTAEFSLAMPLLLTGDYSICAAIASGTLLEHTQHHWMHDALMFKVHSSSLAGVLMGIPIDSIAMHIEGEPV